MDREATIAVAREVVKPGAPFVFATVDADGGPRMRWMGDLMLEEPFIIYMAAGAGSRKLGQLAANPKAQLLFQSPDYSTVATLYGECVVVDEAALKQRIWEAIPALVRFVSGPDDPSLAVLRFTTRRLEVMKLHETGEKPSVVEF